jgi:aspartate/methionine/tyrosine aminotransferase
VNRGSNRCRGASRNRLYLFYIKCPKILDAAGDKDMDVIILRTFSKIYGIAGLHAGAALGRPDLLQQGDDTRTTVLAVSHGEYGNGG